MEGEKRSKNVTLRKTETKGVIITVFVESSTIRSRKSKPHPQFKRPRTSQSQGYDRRALLLAYSRQLRNTASTSQDVHVPITKKWRHKIKKENCSCFEFCSRSSRMIKPSNRRWRYHRVPCVDEEEVNRWRKKKCSDKTSSQFLRKLKGVLKDMSCKEI